MGNTTMKDFTKSYFMKLYEEVYIDLYKFALYTLRHKEDAEDVVSDAVTDAYQGFNKLRNIKAFRPWIFKILSAKCKRKLKEYTQKTDELPEALASQENLTESVEVREAFDQLSDEERMIISLHIFSGYNSREIGKILSLNDNTVRSKESRALEKMRNWLNA